MLILSLLNLIGSYFHMHIFNKFIFINFIKKLKAVLSHYFNFTFGLGSISWSGHQNYISSSVLKLILLKVDFYIILILFKLLFLKVSLSINLTNFFLFKLKSLVGFYLYRYKIEEIRNRLL